MVLLEEGRVAAGSTSDDHEHPCCREDLLGHGEEGSELCDWTGCHSTEFNGDKSMANKYGKSGSHKDSMFFEDEPDEENYVLQEEAWDEFEDAYAYQEDDDDAVYYEDYTEEVVGADEAVSEFDEIYGQTL